MSQQRHPGVDLDAVLDAAGWKRAEAIAGRLTQEAAADLPQRLQPVGDFVRIAIDRAVDVDCLRIAGRAVGAAVHLRKG